jgi:hypothetical protein
MRYVTIYEAVANAMIALGLEQDEYRNIFTDWAYEATRSIGVSEVNLKSAEITITSGLAAVPSDMAYLSQIAVKKNGTEDYAYPMFDTSYWPSIPNGDQAYMLDENYYVNIQGNNFVISSDITDAGFNRLVIQYWGYPIDNEGNPLIPEYYGRAATAYIEFMHTKRLRSRNRQEVPMSEVDYLERRWLRLKLDAVSQRNQPSKPEIEAAILQWSTMLPNQRRLNRRTHRREGVI